ncbi:MAG: PCYCGC motif-containing (lipo)protein [Acidobacteriota bacterium]
MLFAAAGVVAAAALVAGTLYMQRSTAQPEAVAQAAAAVPAAAPEPDAQQAVLKPHPQTEFPPLRLPGYALPRPSEVITAAYRFAAEHPEILTYVPCFCGCERSGHKGNHDCFVQKRGANGDVTEWTEHGMECTVCIDVATQAEQMFASGASVRDIRAAVEAKWGSTGAQNHAHTPTPDPPGN